MGCENFQVMLRGHGKINEAINYFNCAKNIDALGNGFYIFSDGNHIIEFEVRSTENNIEISCQFALCNPSSIDDVFISLIHDISNQLSLHIDVMTEISTDRNMELNTKLFNSIQYSRYLWQEDFGTETFALTCENAIKKFILHNS